MMSVIPFLQFHNLRSHHFSKSKLFCLFLVVLITSWLLNPTYATAAAPSLKQEVLEQGFRRSLTEIKQLLPHGSPATCFISRVCEDDTWGDRIEFYLRQLGVQTIYDKKDLRGNDDIQAFVERINTADFVMTLFSPRYLENYGKRTWIYNEAGLIRQRLLRGERGFHIPVLLAGCAGDSMPPDFFDPVQTLYYPMTTETVLFTDEDACHGCLFRVLKEQLFRRDFEERAPGAARFNEIEKKFDVRRSKLPSLFFCTEFQSSTGFFPQSLKTYNAFLDRTDETGLSYLDRIFEELFINEDATTRFSTTTLCASGMGGVGKTTLATEYARKYGPFYDLVYWLDGSSSGNVLRSCLGLLEVLGVPIPERGNTDEKTYYSNVVRLVNGSLPRLKEHSLLVIDNAEDPALVAELSPQKGHILYTSRNNDWFRKIDVDVLKREESVKLLLQLTGLDQALADQALILAEELGDLPLALAQAAAYIKQQKLPSFQTYLEHYRASQADLLARRQIQPSLNKREAVVMTTWNATMQKLSPESKRLMSYFAYLEGVEIPTSLFASNRIPALDVSLKELDCYSMVKHPSDRVSIHRLVQAVIRINEEGERGVRSMQDLVSLFIESADESRGHKNFFFGDVERKTILKLRALLPHALQLTKYARSSDMQTDALIDLYVRVASFLNRQHQPETAEALLLNAKEIAVRLDKPENVFDWINRNLLNAYVQMGPEARAKILGLSFTGDPLTMGVVSRATGDINSAKCFALQAVSMFKAAFDRVGLGCGEGYDLARAHRNVGIICLQRGEFVEALPHFNQAESLYQQLFRDSPNDDKATVLFEKARSCVGIGDVEVALGLFEDALKMFDVLYPKGTPTVAYCLINYAETLKATMMSEDAILQLKKAIAIPSIREHPILAECQARLARYEAERGV